MRDAGGVKDRASASKALAKLAKEAKARYRLGMMNEAKIARLTKVQILATGEVGVVTDRFTLKGVTYYEVTVRSGQDYPGFRAERCSVASYTEMQIEVVS